MKKVILLLLVSILLFPLFANVSFGYSLSLVGEQSTKGEAFGAISIASVFSPWNETHVGDVEVEALLSPVAPFFNEVNMKISSPLFLTTSHPFSFIFANAVLWTPRLAFGAQYRLESEWSIYMSFAPLSFQDTGYIYEFLSPYALYNPSQNKWGYGAYIMKFTAFLGGNS